jgi:nicotinate-nucleotide adenylyltransferase
MKICLFGGAFDPPHLGHQTVAAELIARGLADQIWFVPTKIHSFGKVMTDEQHRLALLQLIQTQQTRIETYELEQAGVSYSFNTLEALAKKHPEHQFSWVIGSDNLAKFHEWGDAQGRNYQQLLAAFPFYVYPRHGFPFDPLYPGMTALKELPEITVSSTQVRERVVQNQSLTGFVDPAVANYINKHQLYS